MGSDDVISPSEGCEDIIAFVPSITILPTISHAMVSANCYKKSGVKWGLLIMENEYEVINRLCS
jgi:hypothetical protein